jgi:hypothetical protein
MTLRLMRFSLLLLLAGVLSSHAAEYCVGTPGTFQNALDQAELDGEDSLIKVRAGTYTLSNDLRYEPALEYVLPAGRLTIRGGYDVGCNSYSLTPGATTIVSSNQSALEIFTSTDHASVAGMSFQGSALMMESLVLSACPAQRHTFAVRRVRIDQAQFHGVAWCHDVVVENSLFTNGVRRPGNTVVPSNTAFSTYLADDDDTYDTASKLTMVNSTVFNGLMSLISEDDGHQGAAYLYNSIFNVSGSDIESEAHVFVRNSRYDGITFQGGALLLPGSVQNTSAASQLDANYVPAVGSPMINAGTSIVPDGLPETDHAGSARVIGAAVDIGALESPVDGTGTFTVTNTNASGAGSLAQALSNANADPGFNRIRFNISGGCPQTIALSGALQVQESVNFDGWSQPGSVKNTSESGFNAVPCVILSGNGGIGIETMGSLGSDPITVRGLAFQGFDLAIALAFGQGHAVYGNQFGGRVGNAGPLLSGNEQAIGLIGGGRTVLGGQPLAYRNLIGASSDVGVLITTFLGGGGDDNSVVGNLIGIGKNGTDNLGNGTGIRINGGFNLIRGNRIGNNTVDGILLSGANAEGNRIEDNLMGAGVAALGFATGNGRMGVMVQSDAHDNQIRDNTIGRNGDDGVRIMPSAGGRNTVAGNHIARNTALGIDLGANGVSSNDADPAICDPTLGCAANRGQNFPVLGSAELRHSGVVPIGRPIRVQGTLRSVLGGPYRIEVFGGDSCEGNGHGEGQRPLAAQALTITNAPYCPPGGGFCILCVDLNCTEPFTIWLPEADVVVGNAITATATSPNGDTSEFSACTTLTEEPGAPVGDAIFADGFEN